MKATCIIRVLPTDKTYTEEEIQVIVADNSRRYYLDDNDQIIGGLAVSFKNEQQNGQVTYGWEYYNVYYSLLTFSGDKSEGKKMDASFSYYSYFYPNYIYYQNEPVTLEIIKNDGRRIWGIFSFIKDEVSHRGYFCDSI